jgi:hypothetical protein
MGKQVPLPGPVCPDCSTQLYLEEGRHDAPYCVGCAPDPNHTVHYVSETYLRARALRRQTAAEALTRAAAAYNAPWAPSTQAETDLVNLLRYDVEIVPGPQEDLEEQGMDDLPL